MTRSAAAAALLVLASSLGGSGCYTAHIGRADLAAAGLETGKPPLPLVVGVSSFEGGPDDEISIDTRYALSKSYLDCLAATRLFKETYTEAEAPDAHVLLRGSIRRVSIYENDWWIVTWFLGAGYFTIIFALFGLPYSTENGDIALTVEAYDRQRAAVVATYETRWTETLIFNIYSSSENSKQSFYEVPKRAVEKAVKRNLEALVADHDRFAKIAAEGARPASRASEGKEGAAAARAPPQQQPQPAPASEGPETIPR